MELPVLSEGGKREYGDAQIGPWPLPLGSHAREDVVRNWESGTTHYCRNKGQELLTDPHSFRPGTVLESHTAAHTSAGLHPEQGHQGHSS